MKSVRVLVVDDELLNREIIQENFCDQPDYQLTIVEDGDTAWDCLQAAAEPFDVILLDRMMPGLDGVALLNRIKDTPSLAHIPVIMQTAAGEPEQIREGMAAGAYYYLTKPYSGDQLLAIVQAAGQQNESRDVLRQRLHDCVSSLRFIQQAEFSFFRTMDEARQLALLLAQTFPEPETALMGISELLLNAVEHGNLELSYEDKKRVKLSDSWQEEIDRRAQLPEFANRVVRVTYERTPQALCLKIYDEGHGFDWQNFLELSPDRACDPNGRGIALARMLSFSTIHYEGAGNIAVAQFNLSE